MTRKILITFAFLMICAISYFLFFQKEDWLDERLAPPMYPSALEKFSQEKISEGLQILDTLRKHYRSRLWEKRWNFLSGYWNLQQGQAKKALHQLERSYTEEDPLHFLTLYYSALSAMRAKKERAAVELFKTLLRKNRSHPYVADSVLLLSDTLIQCGDLEGAKATLLQNRSKLGKKNLSTLLFKLALIDKKAGKEDKAIERFKKIYCLYPLSPESSELETHLSLAKEDQTLWNIDDISLLFKRGNILERNKKFSEALHLYQSIETVFPEYSEDLELALRLGRALYGTRKMEAAYEHLSRIQGTGTLRSEARFLQARISLHNARTRTFKREMEILESSKKGTDVGAKSLIALAEYYDSRGKWNRAFPYYKKYIALYPSGEKIRKILWRTGLIYYLNRDYRNATTIFNDIINEVNNPYYTPATFWAAKCQEQLKNKRRALELYHILMVNSAFGYYGIKAKERFLKLSSHHQREHLMPKGKPLVSSNVPASLSQDFVASQELILLDLKDMALQLLEFACSNRSKDRIEPFLKASEIALELDEPEHATTFVRMGLSHAQTPLSEIPPDFLKLLYPMEERWNICQMSNRFSLDCSLVHAIILQESGFNASAVSRSGAVGLMQIMPDTGKDIARKIGKREHSDSKLFDPEYNILLGCSHFSRMMDRFHGSLELSLSAYNAGEANTKKWRRWLVGHDQEELIDNIPYFETRNYIKKIISHYKIYSELYGL